MKSKRQFVLDTLLPYKEDPSTRGIGVNGSCVYLNKKNGNKCAFGMHLKDPSLYGFGQSAWGILDNDPELKHHHKSS